MPTPPAPGPAKTPITATPDTAPAAPCPDCGSALTADPRFVRWCQACGWNAHPGATTATTRGDRLERRLNRAAEDRLFQRITTSGSLSPVRDGAWVAAVVLASLVHLVTLAIALVGALLIARHPDSAPGLVIGGALILGTVGLRPRLGTMRRVRKRSFYLDRDQVPALYRLTDRIAAELGTAPLRLICFDGRYNASYRRVGLRRQPVLTLGLPLWETLSARQRVALLGHELGHGANGDNTHGLWVGSALGCLEEWYALLTPGRRIGSRGLVALGEMVARIVMYVFAAAVMLLHRLLRRVTVLGSRRAEYLADSMAARIAGNAATAELLTQLTLGDSLAHVLQRRRFRGTRVVSRRRGEAPAESAARPDLWTALRDYLDSVPETERARRLRISELDDSATDSTHPPTHLRIAFIRGQPHPEPLILPDPADLASIDAQLAPVLAAVAKGLE
ncbi:M48 family metalloprotease [Streptacidiphilus cavernicola]|uniref:M48 family metalloprotease n=1 Tax=Streptacidiphilus cavernicola TaxID=3342716 RepID=A0ABV6W5Q9_9ACTN